MNNYKFTTCPKAMNLVPSIERKIVCKWFKSFIRPASLPYILFYLLVQVIFLNSSFAQLQTASYSDVTPEQQNNVIATLKKSSRTFQLIENKGQEGLPENVVAYFSTSSQ